MANLGLLMTGMASGLGKGLQKGLDNYQSYLGTSQLQEERNKMEMERLRLTEGFAADREQRGYAHGEQLQRQGFAHAEKQQGQAFEHAEAMTGQQIGSAEAMKELDRGEREKHHREEMDLKNRELSVQERHYKDMAPWYKRAGVNVEKLNPLLKAQVDTLIASAKNSRDAAAKYDELSSKAVEPDKQADLMKMAKRERDAADAREQQAFSLLGMKMESPKGKTSIIDPDEPGPTSTPSKGGTPEAPVAPKTELPIMGNPTQPGPEDIAAYLREHEEATKRGSGVAAVVENFRRRFGRIPTEEEMTAANRRGLLQSPAR